jgi:hypothetical protein
MRVLILGLLLAACAHQQKVYSIGDGLSIVADGMEISVRNERLSSYMMGMPKGPLFMSRPGKDFEKTHCLEGFYNPDEIPFGDSRAADELRPFAICHVSAAPADPAAFVLGMRERMPGGYTKQVKQLQFSARVVSSGSTDVKVEGTDPRRVRLDTVDAAVFRDHPEIIGAMVTLGVLPASLTTLQR